MINHKVLVFLFAISCSLSSPENTEGNDIVEFYCDAPDDHTIDSVVLEDVEQEEEVSRTIETTEEEDGSTISHFCPTDMALIDEGFSIMGSEAHSDSEKPQHTVFLDSYCFDIYEVTNRQYKECESAGVCQAPPVYSNTREHYYDNESFENFPVVYATWSMASIYCEWRGKRLPSEAEWEKAARGGCEFADTLGCDEKDKAVTFPWRYDGIDCSLSNFLVESSVSPIRCVGDTSYVGQTTGTSIYGIFDMAGNVAEWVFDYFGQYCVSDFDTDCIRVNPVNDVKSDFKVLRGGSCLNYYNDCRVSARQAFPEDIARYNIGIRCARNY